MAVFVIVHGAWSGAHAWRKMRPVLRAAGHDVFTPALTGLGERAHLASSDVDLDTHVQDVVGVLEYEDLQEVVLLGHSYGGIVITGAADRVAPRLAQLVYLDAEVPEDGQSEYDLVPPDERATYEEAARTKGDGWCIPPPVPETCRTGSIPTSGGCSRGWSPSRSAPSHSLCSSRPRLPLSRAPTSTAPGARADNRYRPTSSGRDPSPGGPIASWPRATPPTSPRRTTSPTSCCS